MESFVFVKCVANDCFDSFKGSGNLWFVLNLEFIFLQGLLFDRSLVRVCLSGFIISVVGIFACVMFVSHRDRTWFWVCLTALVGLVIWIFVGVELVICLVVLGRRDSVVNFRN